MNGNVEIKNLNIQLGDLGRRRLNLEFLNSIKEINGYLLISNTSIERLNFENLYLIRGDQLVDGSSLIITNNLNLGSVILLNLKHIENGTVRIKNNQKLCYIHTINWNEFFVYPNERRVILGNNSIECKKHENVCKQKNVFQNIIYENNYWSENICQKRK